MILPVLNVHSRDAHLAMLALEVCKYLDGCQEADLLIVHPEIFDVSTVAALARQAFKRVLTDSYPEWSGDRLWPKPQNWAWQRVVRIIQNRFRETQYDGWLWWEADATPVRKDWLKELTAAYVAKPKALFAGVQCFNTGVPYMNGVAIYPINAIEPLANTCALYDLSNAFDTAAAFDVMKSFRSMEPLMQHFMKKFGGRDGRRFREIPKDAAFVHGCTDGSLHQIVLGRDVTRVTTLKTFYHSGDLGDVVYSLPAVRELGGGEFYLGPDNRSGGLTRTKMTEPNAKLVIPLLEAQPYIKSATYRATLPEDISYDLNAMRLLIQDHRIDMDTGYNLARCYLRTFGVPRDHDRKPWLTVPSPVSVAPVVINRSPRYQDAAFRWDRILRTYPDCVFIGLQAEHEDFCKRWSATIPFHPTENLLEAAQVIAGANLFIGNQSSCYAIAEGLKKRAILETCPSGSNTIFNRKDVLREVGDQTPLPRIEKRATEFCV
jgi:hypothetical protein